MARITEDDETTAYEYLCSMDTEGTYHMDEVSEDNLYELSSLQEIVTG
ncbi:MAG: hypothetical protein LUH00_03010 [Lachnospiraceae bacterium]|nr:hypothetical protein [Lachnospiraceae bacterium]